MESALPWLHFQETARRLAFQLFNGKEMVGYAVNALVLDILQKATDDIRWNHVAESLAALVSLEGDARDPARRHVKHGAAAVSGVDGRIDLRRQQIGPSMGITDFLNP